MEVWVLKVKLYRLELLELLDIVDLLDLMENKEHLDIDLVNLDLKDLIVLKDL